VCPSAGGGSFHSFPWNIADRSASVYVFNAVEARLPRARQMVVVWRQLRPS
jgi:hypothetical protein